MAFGLGFNVPFAEAIAAARARRVMLPPDYYGQRQARARAISWAVTGSTSVQQAQAVLDSLVDSLTSGGTLAEWQKGIREGTVGLDLPPARLETIYRTTVQSAYGHGKLTQAVRNAASRPYLMYSAVNDSRTRPAHRAMHKTILPIFDPWWLTHTPPNGFNCRCTVIPLTTAQAQARGITSQKPTAEADQGFGSLALQTPRQEATAIIQRVARRADPTLALAAVEFFEGGIARQAMIDPTDGQGIQPPDL
jgi:SPP1 gp7 family putative phage head morphogenesis protein